MDVRVGHAGHRSRADEWNAETNRSKRRVAWGMCRDGNRSQATGTVSGRGIGPHAVQSEQSRVRTCRGEEPGNATRLWHCIAGKMDGVEERMIDIHFRNLKQTTIGGTETWADPLLRGWH